MIEDTVRRSKLIYIGFQLNRYNPDDLNSMVFVGKPNRIDFPRFIILKINIIKAKATKVRVIILIEDEGSLNMYILVPETSSKIQVR